MLRILTALFILFGFLLTQISSTNNAFACISTSTEKTISKSTSSDQQVPQHSNSPASAEEEQEEEEQEEEESNSSKHSDNLKLLLSSAFSFTHNSMQIGHLWTESDFSTWGLCTSLERPPKTTS